MRAFSAMGLKTLTSRIKVHIRIGVCIIFSSTLMLISDHKHNDTINYLCKQNFFFMDIYIYIFILLLHLGLDIDYTCRGVPCNGKV